MEVVLEVGGASTEVQKLGYIRNDRANMPRRLVLMIIISFMSVDQQQNFDKQKPSDTFY